MDTSTIIIGGGIAGLTAAFTLQQAGLKVVLLEKSARVGGAIHTVEQDGFLTEIGPNTILDTSPEVTETIGTLGIADEVLYADDAAKTRYVVRGAAPVALPTSPAAFLKTPLFSLRAKVRLLKEPFIAPWNNRYEESLAQFVLRRLGPEFLDYAINPFVGGVYAGNPEALSVLHGFPRLYALEQKYGGLIKGQVKGAKERRQRAEKSKTSARMFSFKHGMKTLPEALSRALGDAVYLNARVDDLTWADGTWQITYTGRDARSARLAAQTVLYAGRACGLKDLTVRNEQVADFGYFDGIQYPPVSVLALGFERERVRHPLDGFGMLIPEAEGMQTLGALFSSTLFPNRAPQGTVLLTVFIGGTRQPEHASLSTPALVDLALEDLRVLLGVEGRPSFVHHTYWEKAIPQYNVGYGRFKDRLDDLERRHPGLFFAGNYRGGISVADTMKNGLEVARRMIEYAEAEHTKPEALVKG